MLEDTIAETDFALVNVPWDLRANLKSKKPFTTWITYKIEFHFVVAVLHIFVWQSRSILTYPNLTYLNLNHRVISDFIQLKCSDCTIKVACAFLVHLRSIQEAWSVVIQITEKGTNMIRKSGAKHLM